MVPCTLVVHSAERSLHRVSPRTVCRQPEHLTARMPGSPLRNGFRFMHTVVIRDHIDARKLSSWVRGIQQRQEIPQYPIIFTRTEAIEHLARGEMQPSSQRVLLMLPWRHDLGLRA